MAPYPDHRSYASNGLYPPAQPTQGQRSREHSPDPSRLRPDPRYYSSRYGSSRPSSRAPSEHRNVLPNSRVKRTWPPSPVVEDEKTSLAKEAKGPHTADSDKTEDIPRGTVDQQPIILEVQGYATPNARPPPNEEKGSSKDDTSLPPRDSPRKNPRGRRNTTDDSLELPETPIFTRRAPSPYVFLPKAPDASKSFSTDSGYFSSDLRSSAAGTPLSEKRKGYAPPQPENITSEAVRGAGQISNKIDDDNAADSDSVVVDSTESNLSNRGSRAPAPYSFVKSNAQDKDGRGSAVRDFAKAEPQPRLAEIKASDSAASSGRPRFDEASRAPATAQSRLPVQIATGAAMQYAADSLGAGLSRNSSGSRPSSPADGSHSYPTTPPRSPRSSSYQYKTDTPKSARSSMSGSVSGSRPSSPVPGYGGQSFAAAPRPEEGMRRSSTFPVVMEDRSQRTSRLASSSVHVDDDLNSPSTARNSASLPYPVDDMNLMPSEEHHRYKPRALGDPSITRLSTSRPSTRDGTVDSPINSRPTSLEVPASRPRMSSRHSFDASLPALATVSVAALARGTEPDSPVTPKVASSNAERLRARCLGVQNSRNYSDWYILNGCSDVDVCPACFETHISPSSFKASFTQLTRTQPNPGVECSFRDPWYKLAWQMTRQQHRFDLDLLYGVARVTEAEIYCPGAARDNRAWHTIYDKRGEAVHGFDICPCDVKKVEALMPTLRGAFEESHNSGRRRRCNLRVSSTRCIEYLDELRAIDEEASKKRKQAEMRSFVELAHHKAQMRECARDDLVVDKEWHFAPQLPEFTVCEECYSSTVWPAIADGSLVASRFKRTPELVYEEKAADGRDPRRGGGAGVVGTSCQLYSPRMRRVFRKAIQTNDFPYLASRAKERKDVEMELQATYARLQVQVKEWERANGKSSERRSAQAQQQYAGLMGEFEKITEEWRKWE